MSNEDDPLKGPPRRPYEPKEDNSPYWGRTTLLTRFSNWGIRGKLLWVGCILTGVNCISYFFGFVWIKLIGVGVGALIADLLLPSSVDE